jgi:hypothetical protein
MEGEFEFVGDFGPEFAEDVVAHVLKDAVAYAACCGGETAVIVGMIGVAYRDGAGCA